jgi:hypothetical protein
MNPPDLHDLDKRLSSHEAVCAERYASIRDDLRTIKKVLWTALCAVIAIESRALEIVFSKFFVH